MGMGHRPQDMPSMGSVRGRSRHSPPSPSSHRARHHPDRSSSHADLPAPRHHPHRFSSRAALPAPYGITFESPSADAADATAAAGESGDRGTHQWMNGTEVHAYRVFDKALSRTTWVVPFPNMRVQAAPAQFRFHETMTVFALGSLVDTSKESKDLNARDIVVEDKAIRNYLCQVVQY